MTKQLLSPICLSMVNDVKSFNWFSAVGRPLQPTDDAVLVPTWKKAAEGVLNRNWENYTIEAGNAVSVAVWEKSIDVFNTQWNVIATELNELLPEGFFEPLAASIPLRADKRAAVIDEVRIMVRNACVEEHWSSFVDLPVRAYARMYKWLGDGRLPCGALGRFPSLHMKVY